MGCRSMVPLAMLRVFTAILLFKRARDGKNSQRSEKNLKTRLEDDSQEEIFILLCTVRYAGALLRVWMQASASQCW